MTNAAYKDANSPQYIEQADYFRLMMLNQEKMHLENLKQGHQSKINDLNQRYQNTAFNAMWKNVNLNGHMQKFANPQTRSQEIYKLHNEFSKTYGVDMNVLNGFQDPSIVSAMNDAVNYRKLMKMNAPRSSSEQVPVETLHAASIGGQVQTRPANPLHALAQMQRQGYTPSDEDLDKIGEAWEAY